MPQQFDSDGSSDSLNAHTCSLLVVGRPDDEAEHLADLQVPYALLGLDRRLPLQVHIVYKRIGHPRPGRR